jgi:PRC-barrel domain
MKRSSLLLPTLVCATTMLPGLSRAQLAPQTVTLMKVDPQTLATGYRGSKMIGSSVVNETNQTVGTLDDMIITPGGQAPYVILSVGGFLGLGTKYVALPFTSLKIVDKKLVLPGGTKDALTSLPDFKYNTND